jgi:hypothetical protein
MPRAIVFSAKDTTEIFIFLDKKFCWDLYYHLLANNLLIELKIKMFS